MVWQAVSQPVEQPLEQPFPHELLPQLSRENNRQRLLVPQDEATWQVVVSHAPLSTHRVLWRVTVSGTHTIRVPVRSSVLGTITVQVSSTSVVSGTQTV